MRQSLKSKWMMFALAAGVMAASASRAEDKGKNDLELAMRLENAFTSVAERSFKSVVVITNKRAQRMPGMGGGQGVPPELFRYFFGQPYMNPREGRQQRNPDQGGKPKPRAAGKGSGVIIRKDGYVVTNYHVIDGADALEVQLKDGTVFDNAKDENAVKVVGVDKATDLAVLKIGGDKYKNDLPVIPFADSDTVKVGHWAIAVGAPFELSYSVTFGHVSQKGRYDTGMTTFENYIQTDASINPGNSGGPLLNIRGELIGVNEFIMTGGGMSRGSVGIGFAIASNLVKEVTDDLIEHGEVIRPFLGISMEPLDDMKKRAFGVDYGVLVKEVVKGDPADKAGVQHGDIIQKVGDKQVRTPHDLLFAVLDYEVGDKIKLTIDRRGETIIKNVTAKKRGAAGSSSPDIQGEQDILDALGMALEEGEDGVYISGVVGGSPAEDAELRRGDKILEVNRIVVENTKDVVKALDKGKNNAAIFYIERRGDKFFVGIPLGDGKDE